MRGRFKRPPRNGSKIPTTPTACAVPPGCAILRRDRTSSRSERAMNERIRQILSNYDAENPGVRTNLARMLNHGTLAGTGRMVILPVDQGFEHGPHRSFAPNAPGYDPDYHFQLA